MSAEHERPATRRALVDRVHGTLLGLAAGDRNGGPAQMAIRLAGSLAQLGRYDREDVLDRYLAWWREEGFDAGASAAHVFDAIESGVPRAEAPDRVHTAFGGRTAGCNPAHRSPPLAMAAFLPDDRLVHVAQREAALTHRHPLAGDAAAFVVVLCRELIRGREWTAALRLAAVGREPAIRAALPGAGRGPLGRGGFAPEALRAALHYLDAASSFEDALEASLEFAGPANYCPVLVGAIGGARWGEAAIPLRALEHCGEREWVRLMAYWLAESWMPAREPEREAAPEARRPGRDAEVRGW